MDSPVPDFVKVHDVVIPQPGWWTQVPAYQSGDSVRFDGQVFETIKFAPLESHVSGVYPERFILESEKGDRIVLYMSGGSYLLSSGVPNRPGVPAKEGEAD